MDELQRQLCGFWFGDCFEAPDRAALRSRDWFVGSSDLDEAIRCDFAELPERAVSGELDAWRADPRGALALVLVLDQFPRNLHRGEDRAFAYDALALEVALEAMGRGFDEALHPLEAVFLYLPMEHSESLEMQERSVAAFEALEARASDGLEPLFAQFSHYARAHREAIRRFGRFPHRNSVLGRETTPDERAYLDEGGGFG